MERDIEFRVAGRTDIELIFRFIKALAEYENLSDEVIKLTEQLGLRKFYAVGHSMGGGIALHIMVNRPGRIIRAVLINPVCFKSPGVQILKIPGMEFIAPRLGGRWSVRASLEDAFFNIDLVSEAMVDEYARPIGKPGYYKALISLEKQFYSPEFEKLGRSYRLIHNPVKIIWGSGDTWRSSSQGRELNEMIMDSSIMEMDRYGHAPHQECSDRVTPIMLGFLKE
jgi:pimeloyl-ACP methyl ester carboxylesterase